MSEEHPLDDSDERGRQAADCQYQRAQKSGNAITTVTKTADEGNRNGCARQ